MIISIFYRNIGYNFVLYEKYFIKSIDGNIILQSSANSKSVAS